MPVAAYAAESTTSQLPAIEVVGTTPLPGLFTPIYSDENHRRFYRTAKKRLNAAA